jgi:hypothetical protein
VHGLRFQLRTSGFSAAATPTQMKTK